MEPVLEFLKRRLREVGPAQWEAIADQCGVARTLPRKLVYGDRSNPGVLTIQPLLTYFQSADAAAGTGARGTCTPVTRPATTQEPRHAA